MNKKMIVGASIGSGEMNTLIADEQFNIIDRANKQFSLELGKESIIVRLEKTITSLPNLHLARAVGVSIPAVFDPSGKKVKSSSIKGLVGANIYQLLSKRIDLPIFVLRRSFCSLLSEQAFGAAKDVKDAIYVEIGRDVNAAFLISGKIYRGSTNSAGRIAKTIVDITREKRNRIGEFGSLISGEGIQVLTGKSVYQILKENPESELVTKQILRDLKESLLTGLYNVKLLLDPELFIINGDIVESFSLFKTAFQDLGVRVVKSEVGRDAPALGAAIATYNSVNVKLKTQNARLHRLQPARHSPEARKPTRLPLQGTSGQVADGQSNGGPRLTWRAGKTTT